MKTKLTLLTVLAAALYVGGCASPSLNQGLVAYYPFNGNAKDMSGNGYDGKLNSPQPTTDRHGVDAQAYHFKGGDHIALPPFQYGGEFSISLWVYSEDSDRPELVFSKKISPAQESVQWTAHYPKGIYLFRVFSSDDIFIGRTAHINKSTPSERHWTHLATTYDGGKTPSAIKIYRDGIRIDDSDVVHNKDTPFTVFNDLKINTEIGSQNRGVEAFQGSMDDVRIYSRALSAEEVKALCDLEKPKGK